MKQRLAAAAFFLALAVSLALLVVPVYSGFTNGMVQGRTLLDENGTRVLAPLSIPLVITLPPLAFPRQGVRILGMVLLWVFCLLGSMSIGLLYVPSALAMLLAACVDSSSKLRDFLP